MAITGVVLVGFVIAHMVGNLKIFSGPDEINAYSRFLREVGYARACLWTTALDGANRPAHMCGPSHHRCGPAQPDELGCATGWISRQAQYRDDLRRAHDALGWSPAGCLHHFSSSSPDRRCRWVPAGQFRHLAVYQNVMAAFAVWPVALFYVVAMGALCLHLDHGIWSMLQTLGWNTARNETNSARSLHEPSRSWSFLDSAQFRSRSGQAGCINR